MARPQPMRSRTRLRQSRHPRAIDAAHQTPCQRPQSQGLGRGSARHHVAVTGQEKRIVRTRLAVRWVVALWGCVIQRHSPRAAAWRETIENPLGTVVVAARRVHRRWSCRPTTMEAMEVRRSCSHRRQWRSGWPAGRRCRGAAESRIRWPFRSFAEKKWFTTADAIDLPDSADSSVP